MGNANSNLTQSSEAGTLNWNDVNTERNNGINISKLENGMEEIDLEINPLSDTENSLADVFEKLANVEKTASEEDQQGSSPFISTELYKKIMEGGNDEDNSSSPFISTEVYKKIMNGGAKDLDSSSSSDSDTNSSESSTSSSDLLRALSEMTLTSSDYPRKEDKKHSFKKHTNETKYHSNKHEKKNEPKYDSQTSSIEVKGYGFSETSSVRSADKYFIGGNTSETPYNVNSSSIATSDINLVSVDSVNGRRFISK